MWLATHIEFVLSLSTTTFPSFSLSSCCPSSYSSTYCCYCRCCCYCSGIALWLALSDLFVGIRKRAPAPKKTSVYSEQISFVPTSSSYKHKSRVPVCAMRVWKKYKIGVNIESNELPHARLCHLRPRCVWIWRSVSRVVIKSTNKIKKIAIFFFCCSLCLSGRCAALLSFFYDTEKNVLGYDFMSSRSYFYCFDFQ